MPKIFTQKELKNELIKLIKTSKIEDIICEPRYIEGYEFKNHYIGSTITIRTSILKKRGK